MILVTKTSDQTRVCVCVFVHVFSTFNRKKYRYCFGARDSVVDTRRGPLPDSVPRMSVIFHATIKSKACQVATTFLRGRGTFNCISILFHFLLSIIAR